MTRVFRKVFFGIISFALTLWVLMGGFFPAVNPVSAKADTVTYEQTNVMDDLKGSTIDGKPFSLTEYSFNAFKETEMISFVEYCYSFYENKQDSYGFYIYVYNPKGLTFDTDSNLNCIQFAYGLDSSTNYAKYPLKFLNCSTGTNYEGLFYKFKVSLTDAQRESILATVNSTERVYRVSSIELKETGKTNATDFSVGTTYRYSGYAAGYGSNSSAENTLVCKSEDAEVLALNVHHTQYRPEGTNGKNKYTQDSLHSVYFAVPNDIIEKYGEMTAVHATWRDAVLKPGLVTGDEAAYKEFDSLLGMSADSSSRVYIGDYSFSKDPIFNNIGYLSGDIYCGVNPFNEENATFNGCNVLTTAPGRKRVNPLYMLFYSDDDTDVDNYTLSSERILEYLKNSPEKYGGDLVNSKYAMCMFESVDEEWTEVNFERDYEFPSLTSITISQKWWQKWLGISITNTTTFDGIKAIHAVTDEDITGYADIDCESLYIDKRDYDDFKNFYNVNKSLCTVYLFRYQISDYVSEEATLCMKSGGTWKPINTNAYFFQETVNLDFDIIDVTFSNGETSTVIPVVSDPIDVVPDATPPVYTTSDKESWWKKLISTILGLITFVLIAFLCISLFPQIVNLLAWAIQSVVKGIGAVFRAIGNLFRKNNKK